MATPAFAQQQQQVTPQLQAVFDKLNQEIGSSLRCSADLITANAKIAELEAQLKAKDEKK